MSIYVGIDPSITNTGVVLLDDNSDIVTAADGRMAYKSRRFKCSTDKYIRQAEYIINILLKYAGDIKCIAYENYSFNSVHKGYSLAEYGGILKSRLWAIGHDVLLVAPQTNKKFATGYGMSKKDSMVNQAMSEVKKFKDMKPSEDIADAYFLAKIALYVASPDIAAVLDKDSAYSEVRKEVACKLHIGG